MESTPTVLVVDDEPFNVEILLEYLEYTGYNFETAEDGQEAWEKLEADPEKFDVVILDRMMPRMNGLEVLGRIKEHPILQSVPVILQTALAAENEILEGMQAGAYYYLTKPFNEAMLLSVVSTAIEDRKRYRHAIEDSDLVVRTFGLMSEGTFSFKTLSSARDLATFLANACPDPRRVVIGLSELLVNAVEHGNLKITYDEKSKLREENRWEEEVEARLADPENADKEVSVRYRRDDDAIRVIIKDQGEGFDWEQFLEIDPSRAFDTHGRGIAMSRMISFDNMEFRGNGSEVEVTINLNDADRQQTPS